MVTELTEAQWDQVQDTVKTEYDFGQGSSRACVTFAYGELERHAEMPVGAFVGVLAGLGLTQALSMLQTAQAVLTPDALADHLDGARSAADPARDRANHPSRTGSPQASTDNLEGR
jgi:hypothetical protein